MRFSVRLYKGRPILLLERWTAHTEQEGNYHDIIYLDDADLKGSPSLSAREVVREQIRHKDWIRLPIYEIVEDASAMQEIIKQSHSIG